MYHYFNEVYMGFYGFYVWKYQKFEFRHLIYNQNYFNLEYFLNLSISKIVLFSKCALILPDVIKSMVPQEYKGKNQGSLSIYLGKNLHPSSF